MMNPAVQTALTALKLAQAHRFDEVRDLFAPQLQAMVTPETLCAGWNAELARHGDVSEIGGPLSEPAGPGAVLVKVPVRCERGAFTLLASATEEGRLVGLQLAPPSAAEPMAPWRAPGYADPDAFDEQEVTLGSGPLAVPGTLSVPRRPAAARHPAVAMLAGSGSNDRDETIGRNKPLKDIAWGLASRGVVVLRFDKVTHAHAAELKDVQEFTLDDEYLPHALAAVKLLQQHPAVEPERIHILGHSLGGTVAPRVAAAEPAIAGMVILAGGAQPLHWKIVDQLRHLASLTPGGEAAAAPMIEALSEKARAVDSPDLSMQTPPDRLPLGAPASYWLDLRDYDAPQAAAGLHKPMLILQGGRDYQVTVEDDLARWRSALGGRPEVTITVHPADNHLLFTGEGPSTPAEYEPAQHVDPAVIDDIARWLQS